MGHYLVHGGEGLVARLARPGPVHPQAPQVPRGPHVPHKRSLLVHIVAVVTLQRRVTFGRAVVELVVYRFGVVERQNVRGGRRRRELLMIASQKEVAGGVPRVVVEVAGVVITLVALVEMLLRRVLHHRLDHHLAGVWWRAHLQTQRGVLGRIHEGVDHPAASSL